MIFEKVASSKPLSPPELYYFDPGAADQDSCTSAACDSEDVSLPTLLDASDAMSVSSEASLRSDGFDIPAVPYIPVHLYDSDDHVNKFAFDCLPRGFVSFNQLRERVMICAFHIRDAWRLGQDHLLPLREAGFSVATREHDTDPYMRPPGTLLVKKKSGINAAFHSFDLLRLHDVDFFITLCRFICNAVDEKGVVAVFLRSGEQLRGKLSPDIGRDCAWVGRCLDLEKAYQQVPLASQSLKLAVLLVREPLTNAFRFFVSNSLPFGACAAVYSFNRISRSLLHLATTLCGVIGGVFYDDFPLTEPALTARLCTVSIEALLDSLGWRYSRDSEKDKPFASQFNLLGVQLSLDSLHLGSIALENKPSRVAKLLLVAQQMCASGELSRAEAMSLQGQLNFMVGFASGRSLKLVCRALSNLVYSNRAWTRDEVKQLGGYLKCCLEALTPKSMCLKGGSRPLVIFNDAAYEQGLWHQDTEDQIIAQAEAFAMVIARDYAATFAKGRRTFFFVDNESARCCMIRGSSPVRALLALAHAFYASECRDQLVTWIERVPSASNVADLPSRGECAAAAKMVGGRVINNIDSIVKIAAQRCSDVSALPWSLLACHFKGPVPAFHFS
ncbi:NAGLU [Symbiodinium sp. CCMP2592]|nr:NAGLU [Symbiodinium sp. CCMP2592]